MYTFLAILFLTLAVYRIFMGSGAAKRAIEIADLNLQKKMLEEESKLSSLKTMGIISYLDKTVGNTDKIREIDKKIASAFLPLLWTTLVIIVEMIVIIIAFSIPVMQIPTGIFILLMFISYLIAKRYEFKGGKEDNLANALQFKAYVDKHIKVYSLKFFLMQLVNTIYYFMLVLALMAPDKLNNIIALFVK